jgi:hypothetical protein
MRRSVFSLIFIFLNNPPDKFIVSKKYETVEIVSPICYIIYKIIFTM